MRPPREPPARGTEQRRERRARGRESCGRDGDPFPFPGLTRCSRRTQRISQRSEGGKGTRKGNEEDARLLKGGRGQNPESGDPKLWGETLSTENAVQNSVSSSHQEAKCLARGHRGVRPLGALWSKDLSTWVTARRVG